MHPTAPSARARRTSATAPSPPTKLESGTGSSWRAGRAGPAPSPGAVVLGRNRLQVRVVAPPSVPVGGAMDVFVRVESGRGAARRPEPEANLFFEVRGQDGRGVQWKAATTNALGKARVTLVALEQPGSFQLWLYADKQGRSAVVHVPVTVQRR
jgi:hypothetical protein